MKSTVFTLCLAVIVPAAAAGQPGGPPREMRFSGPSATAALCESLLDAGRSAEAQGRLDFTAEVEFGFGGSTDATARIWMGSPYSIGRINFDGHSAINDSTLRRALTIYEHDLLDVGQDRKSVV